MADQKWPIAAPFRGSPINLPAVIEAEFTTAQMRELARWLGITPKGNSRVGMIEQVIAVLETRVAKISSDPNALFEGLTAEQQNLARRLLTARDHELPVPRATIMQVWAKVIEERRLTEQIETLRRCALLFPTQAFYPSSYRDVYYQWLPLNTPNAPVVTWELETLSGVRDPSTPSGGAERSPGSQPTSASVVNFLEDFDAFLSAVLQGGVTVRAALPQHKNAARITWLRDWEYVADEAERVLRSRPNWVPEPTSGISVPLTGLLMPDSLSALENQTGLSTGHIEFLFAIACALQLIEAPPPLAPIPTHLQARSSTVEEWLVMTGEGKLRRAWRAWSEEVASPLEVRSAQSALCGASKGNEFQIMRAIGARDLTPAIFAAEWCALRRYVARTLRGISAGGWVAWDEFERKLFEFYPDAPWTFATKADWWFALAASGSRMSTTRNDEWRHSAGRIIEHILSEALMWFGALDVRITDGVLDAFRITPLGESLLGLRDGALLVQATPAEHERKAEPIDWVDQRTLRVPPAPNRAEFISLVRQVADRGSAPFCYIFTTASIERALGAGLTADDVAAQFKSAKVNLPKPVTELFKTLARRHGRVRVYPSLTVLELSDDFAAKELAASTSFNEHAIYQISPRAFVMREEAVDRLIEELKAKGYTPRVI